MSTSFFKIEDLDTIQSLQQLRERLLNFLLISAFVLGTGLLVVAMVPVFRRGLYQFPVIYIVIYLWLILVTFVRRIPYFIRAGSWVTFFFLLGVVNLVLSGFNADAGLFFLTYVSMSALLFDLRRGLLAFGISSITLALFGYLFVNGLFSAQLESPHPADPLLWIIGGAVFIVSGMSLIIAMSVLVRGLVINLNKIT